MKLHTDSFERTSSTDTKIKNDQDHSNKKQNCEKPCGVDLTEKKHNDENKESVTGSSFTKEDKNGTNQVEKLKKEMDSKYFRFAFIYL